MIPNYRPGELILIMDQMNCKCCGNVLWQWNREVGRELDGNCPKCNTEYKWNPNPDQDELNVLWFQSQQI